MQPHSANSFGTVCAPEHQSLFDVGPRGRANLPHKSQAEVETFVRGLREVLGEVLHIRRWTYRHAGCICWAFDVDGSSGSVSLTFVQSGRSRLPHGELRDGTGEVVDSVDAHYLFELLERELSLGST